MNFLLPQSSGTCILRILAAPNARQTQIAGEHDGWLRIRIAAAPESGQANEALRLFLAKKLRLAKNQVQLLSGAANRRKRFEIRAAAAELEGMLGRLCDETKE